MIPSLLWSLALHGTVQAACPSSFRDVVSGAEAALVAYEQADLAGFDATRSRLDEDLACLEAILEPEEALQLHLVWALASWVRQDVPATRAALGAVSNLDADFALQAHVAVLDARLVALADEAATAPPLPETMVLPLVPWSTWRVDGALADGAVPVGRPVLLQLSDTRSDRTRTWYLADGGLPDGFEDPDAQGLVAWRVQGPQTAPQDASLHVDTALVGPTTAHAPAPAPPRARRMALTGGALATVGTFSLLVASGLKGDYLSCADSPDCDESNEIGTLVLNQLTGYGGYALVLTGAGLGVGAVFNRRF